MKKQKDDTFGAFKFEGRDVAFHMLREMGLSSKFKKSFTYVANHFPANTIVPDLEKLEWHKGKNYNWLKLVDGNLTLIFRHYGNHFTVYFKNKMELSKYGEEYADEYETKYGCLTFETDLEGMSNEEHDSYIEDRFKDINLYLPEIIKLIKKGNIHSIWNPYSLKLEKDKERPKHVKPKNVWNGSDDISSIDTFIFACEELFQRHFEIFAETEMLEKVKTIKEGDMFSSYKVTRVVSELKGDYYYNVGIEWINTNFKKEKGDWCDVYSLARYYYEYMFPTKEE